MQLEITPQTQEILIKAGGVVALESTLVTHGFPHPENLAIALESEAAVRSGGAHPATIAVLDGRPHVGLTRAQLETLSRPNPATVKASSRDLSICAARKLNAGTTVAATMRIAHAAGITMFATGGLGGVHRGVTDTWDVSADMTELARTPVVMVCAGAKSLLDLPKTLEVLETLGVPVIGYGTHEFPAFYSRTSGLKLDTRIDTPEEAAAIIRAHRAMSMPGGIVIAQPIDENIALPAEQIEKHINNAITLAAAQGISGKAMTPFMLRHIAEATNGATIEPNKALIRANARLAGEIAAALAA